MVMPTKKEEIRKNLLLRKSKLKEEKLEKIHHLKVELANLASFVMWKYEKRRRLLRKRLLVKRKILKEEKLEKILQMQEKIDHLIQQEKNRKIFLTNRLNLQAKKLEEKQQIEDELAILLHKEEIKKREERRKSLLLKRSKFKEDSLELLHQIEENISITVESQHSEFKIFYKNPFFVQHQKTHLFIDIFRNFWTEIIYFFPRFRFKSNGARIN